MIDHIYLPVSDLKRSSEFYKKVLEPLGIDMPYKLDQPPMRGFAINNTPGFWLKNGEVAKDLARGVWAEPSRQHSPKERRTRFRSADRMRATLRQPPSVGRAGGRR